MSEENQTQAAVRQSATADSEHVALDKDASFPPTKPDTPLDSSGSITCAQKVSEVCSGSQNADGSSSSLQLDISLLSAGSSTRTCTNVGVWDYNPPSLEQNAQVIPSPSQHIVTPESSNCSIQTIPENSVSQSQLEILVEQKSSDFVVSAQLFASKLADASMAHVDMVTSVEQPEAKRQKMETSFDTNACGDIEIVLEQDAGEVTGDVSVVEESDTAASTEIADTK